MSSMVVEEALLPARQINAFVFCPRLFWLQYVAGEFEDNEHTIEGRKVHQRVDKPGGEMPAPQSNALQKGDDDDPGWHTRSLWLSDYSIGVTAKLDLVECTDRDNHVMPVDTKKGTPTPENTLWPADRVQLTLQALLLRAHGYEVTEIAAWYHGSRKRVVEALTEDVVDKALDAVSLARVCMRELEPPKPLVDSPKCVGCSLHALCQPDEVNALLTRQHLQTLEDGDSIELSGIRRIFSPRDDALPLYVQEHGARVGAAKNHLLKITPPKHSENQGMEVGLGTISQVNLMGNVQISTQALQTCLSNDIPVAFFSSGGWYYGRTEGMGNRQVHVRMAQFAAHNTPVALSISRTLIADKIANARTLLRRNADSETVPDLDTILDDMDRLRKQAETAEDNGRLLGLEGMAARHYWKGFSAILANTDEAFVMKGRTRRPPCDPTNALLSFGYALLVKDCQLAVGSSGMDTYLGVFHTPHHGRPSMALDLMELFRPLIVDSAVLQMVRRSWIRADDFIVTGQAVAMKPRARKKFIQTYERRMDELVTHPVFGYRISYRRVLYVQARLIGRVLCGEIDHMPSFRTR